MVGSSAPTNSLFVMTQRADHGALIARLMAKRRMSTGRSPSRLAGGFPKRAITGISWSRWWWDARPTCDGSTGDVPASTLHARWPAGDRVGRQIDVTPGLRA